MIDKIVTLKQAVVGYGLWIEPYPEIKIYLDNPKYRQYALDMISAKRTVAQSMNVPAGATVYVMRQNENGGFIGFTTRDNDIYIRHITLDDICKQIWWDIGASFKDAEAGLSAGDYDASLAKTIAEEMRKSYLNQTEVLGDGPSLRSTGYFETLMNNDARVKGLSDIQQKVLYLAASNRFFRMLRK